MLRMIFACTLIFAGAVQSLRGPFYVLLFYLGLAYFRPETWIWGSQLQNLNLSFIVGVALLGATLISRHERIPPNRVVVLIALFCLHGLAAALLSPHTDWSFQWWTGFAKVAVVSVMIISLVNTQERLKLTLLVITFALGFEGVKQGWAHLVLGGERNLNEMEILGDNNGVAVGMLMLSSVLLAFLQLAQTTSQRALWIFMLLGTVFRALTSYSRGGLLSFLGLCATSWTRSSHKLRSALFIGVVGVTLLSMLPPEYWNRMATISTDEEVRDSSENGRLYFWSVATQMANNHPFFGVGPVGFQMSYNDYDETNGAFGRGRAVHSMWFGVLAEQGYVGLILFVAILTLALVAASKARASARGRPELAQIFAFAGGLQTALIVVTIGGTFLSYHYVEILWHFMALSFAAQRIAVAYDTEQISSTPYGVAVAAAPLAPQLTIRPVPPRAAMGIQPAKRTPVAGSR